VWLAVANSFTMDFLVRRKVSLHIKFNVLDSLPFPRCSADDPRMKYLVPQVLRLTCTGREMVPFWNEMAALGWVSPHTDTTTAPGSVDEDERRQLQGEIDAYVAHEIYGLTQDEVDYVLNTFPIVERRDRKMFGEYRTKRLILEAIDRIGEGAHILDVLALPAIVPALDPAHETVICVWALLRAAGGSITRTELARAFVLRSQPALLIQFAPANLQAVASAWASRIDNRRIAAGALAAAITTLAARDAIKLTTNASGQSVVIVSPHTPQEDQIDEWFIFEARLALRVLAGLPAARTQEVDSAIPSSDRVMLQAVRIA
jgi:hypothetical protein